MITRAVGFALFGLLLNLVLLAILTPEMGGFLKGLEGGMPAARVPIGALLVLVMYLVKAWPIVLMVIGFGIAFPVIYLVMGKKHGIAKAIEVLAKDHLDGVSDYAFDRLVDQAKKSAASGGAASTLASRADMLRALPEYLKKLDAVPRPLRAILRHFLTKLDFGGMVTAAVEEQQKGGDSPLDLEALARTLEARASLALREKVLTPSLRWFPILVTVNFAVFLAVKIAL